jgi:quercetin dioxygenase-like cupin family protein
VQLLSRGTIADPFAVQARGIALAAERPIDVAIAHLTFAVDGSTGWHKHPGPTVVTVISGELTVTDGKCRTKLYEAGDSFVEQGPRRHLAVNTAGTTTKTNVTFFVPQGAPALTVPVAPPTCAD